MFMNMTTPNQSAVSLYLAPLATAVGGVSVRVQPGPGSFDAVLSFGHAGREVRLLAEVKKDVEHQDESVIVSRLNRLRESLPSGRQKWPMLLLAPYIRPRQAQVFRDAGLNYFDLAGNAHVQTRGLLVHIEGRRPPDTGRRGARMGKGWIKVVMALLAKPELTGATYRHVAESSGTSLGTVAAVMRELTERGDMSQASGRRRVADRASLVSRWVQAYADRLRPVLEERHFQIHAEGKLQIWERLRHTLRAEGVAWSLTGADAADKLSGYLRGQETEIYAPVRAFDRPAVWKPLKAQPATGDGNLLVIDPPGPIALEVQGNTDIPVAPPLLVYAELRFRGTEQAMEAAQMLLPRILNDEGD